MLQAELEHAGMSRRELMDLMCYRFMRFNLLSLAQFLNESDFIRFMDRFAGCYIKIPPAAKILETFDEYKLYLLSKRIDELYEQRKINELHELEKQFLLVCRRLHIKYDTGRKVAKKVEEDLQETARWTTRMRELDERQSRQDKSADAT